MPVPIRLRPALLAASVLVLALGAGSRAGQQPPAAGASPGPPPAAAPAPPPAPRVGLPDHAEKIVDYEITVALDPNTKEVKGRERLTWRNPSGDAVPDLWFHLYLNAFKNSRSTFFKESGGQLRGDRMPEDGWGYIDVTSVTLADGTDLTRALTFEAPDDGNKEDQSVARIALPQPVPPGGSVTLDIAFTSKLPRVFARTGYKGDFYLVGQWFPKIAVYEPAGTRGRASGGWNAHQFHANTEFYANYGSYQVTMTLPSRFVVGATGMRTARVENKDGTTTYTYVQGDVHDFAWTADPNYVEVRQQFSATRDVSPEEYAAIARLVARPEEDVRLSDVEITLLLQPVHRPQAQRYMDAAKLALKWFGLWYGRYPYKTLTVVDPAPGASGAGGMEYPTFITGGTSVMLNRWPFDRVRAPEIVTVHEFGHQFWYGLVGNNEFEEAWLDEGFNSYSTAKIVEIGYGVDTSYMNVLGLKVGAMAAVRGQNAGFTTHFDRVRQPAWSYQPGSYSFYSYTKPEILLRTLEHYLGEETMARVMRTYHERWRFRHPSSDDFYAVANEVSGQDLTWFFEQAVEGRQTLDYEIGQASVRRVREPVGQIEEKGKRRLVSQKDEAGDRGGRGPYESTVIVRRRGDFVFPVTIGLKFEGKPLERVAWDGRDGWKKLVYSRPEKLEWAEVDPDRRVLLDRNWSNNGRRVDADGRVAAAWSARWVFWMQQLIASVGW